MQYFLFKPMTGGSGGGEKGLGEVEESCSCGTYMYIVHNYTMKAYTTGPMYQKIIGFHYHVTLKEKFPWRPTFPNHINHTFDYCIASMVVLVGQW